MNLKRLLAHAIPSRHTVRKYFSKDDLMKITNEIELSEALHNAEIVFAMEPNISLMLVAQNYKARDRAMDVFSNLRVWDTERNNGILIYLLLADHDIEIVADRDINRLAGNEYWESIVRLMEDAFHKGDFAKGVIEGIREISILLKKYYPKTTDDTNEISNHPIIL